MEPVEEQRLLELERGLVPIGGPMVAKLVRKKHVEMSAGREKLSDADWEMLVENVSIQVERVWGRRLPNGTRLMLRRVCGLTSTQNHV